MSRRRALAREVGDSLAQCQLTYRERDPIDLEAARREHRAYVATLRDLGVEVEQLPALEGLPDAVFVEDTAVVLDEIAIATTMGTESRRREVASVARALDAHRELVQVERPARLEGGDVIRAGRRLLVGVSSRTNLEGVEALAELVDDYGYTVTPVEVTGCLHLKTACTYLGDDRLLANLDWVDLPVLAGLDVLEVDPDEPWAGNTLRIGDTVLVAAGHDRTWERLVSAGYRVRALDMTEMAKAEAGLTCLSIVF